jgi:hypothetical protein
VLCHNNIKLTQELHVIRAHLLHYEALLEDFKQSVHFVRDVPNPAMNHPLHEKDKEKSRKLLEKECQILEHEILRLDRTVKTHAMRLINVMNLVSQISFHRRFLSSASPPVGF